MYTQYHAKTISFEFPSQTKQLGKTISNYFDTFLNNLPDNKYYYLFIKLLILVYIY